MPKKGSSQVNNRNNKLTNLKVIVFLLNEFVSNFVQAEPKTIQNCKKLQKIKKISPTGNWTPVSRVTGGDTHHYTIEDCWQRMLRLENSSKILVKAQKQAALHDAEVRIMAQF